MTTFFCFPEMFRVHIENSKLKLPENMDEFNPQEFPHCCLFLASHVAKPINLESLESNANIIAQIPNEQVKTITYEELKVLGVEWDYASNII